MKTYPLDLRFSEGDDPMYWSRGHHGVDEFCAALALRAPDIEPQLENVKQTYWRYMPASDYEYSGYMETRPGPGAFPVTYYEVE